jgi:type IX secretion system PorP/SprF family membrane protein
MENRNRKIYIMAFLITVVMSAKAQLNPMGAQYYTNQYLANPALAGAEQGLKLNGGFRKLWSNIPGSPLTQTLTADYGFNKVGVGINALNESAGLQRMTRVVASYAYHLQLNNESNQLHFGLSGGFLTQRLENEDIQGNPNDPLVGMYNNRKAYLDGDFGIAFTSNKLNLQASIPNLKSFFKKDEIKLADVATFYSAASYKINLDDGINGIEIEPKVAYRGVKGFDNIWDAGAQVGVANQQLLFTGMYHSSESASFGFGMDFRRKYLITGLYTTQTSELNGYTNGSFELNFRINFNR